MASAANYETVTILPGTGLPGENRVMQDSAGNNSVTTDLSGNCIAIQAPPSKSWAHRMLICAGLSEGTSTISNVAFSEDILATLDCLRALGADVTTESDRVTITGADPTSAGASLLNCRESGSTMRFFIPVCALSDQEMELEGSGRLLSRPMKVYEDIFAEQGLEFSNDGKAIQLKGRLHGGEFAIDGSISSQFISGLLYALPFAREDSVIRLIPPVESRAYIDITVDALRMFGIDVRWADEYTITLSGGQRYSACDAAVEGDWSNAAFFLAMGAEVSGLKGDSLQSDRVCREYFARLDEGCAELDIAECPDLGPVLMAYAALHHGCVLTGTRRLAIKESDRGEVMKEELARFGVDVITEDNRITVGCNARAPEEVLYGHNDHRIVMSMAVMCSVLGGTISGAGAVSKSYPDFFERLRDAGVEVVNQSADMRS